MPHESTPLRPFTIIGIYHDNDQTYVDTVEAKTAKDAATMAPETLTIIGIFHGSLVPAMWSDFVIEDNLEKTDDYSKVEYPHSLASYIGVPG